VNHVGFSGILGVHVASVESLPFCSLVLVWNLALGTRYLFQTVTNDSTGVVEVINKLNLLRLEVDKASPLMLQSFDFLTLYTKIDLMDLKAQILINKVFHWSLKLPRFRF
jgi:hypothetical protein